MSPTTVALLSDQTQHSSFNTVHATGCVHAPHTHTHMHTLQTRPQSHAWLLTMPCCAQWSTSETWLLLGGSCKHDLVAYPRSAVLQVLVPGPAALVPGTS